MSNHRLLRTARWKTHNGAQFLHLGHHPVGFVVPSGSLNGRGFQAHFILPTDWSCDSKFPQSAYNGTAQSWFPHAKEARQWVRTNLNTWLDGACS